MKATAYDSFGDVTSTAVVLLSAVISHFTGINLDGWCGLLVAAFIVYSGIKSAIETINPLLGQPPSPEFVKQIEAIVYSHPEVIGIHDLVVHNYGPGKTLASLHVEVDGKADMFLSHDVIDLIERRLAEEENIIATIHMDPIVTNDPLVTELRDKVTALIKGMDERLSLHDFRMVKGSTHSNLIFDVAVPFEIKTDTNELKTAIDAAVKTIDETYCTVITIDRA